MTFILDTMLTLSGTAVPSGTCNHGHCQLPPKLKVQTYALNQHYIGHVVLDITLMVMP